MPSHLHHRLSCLRLLALAVLALGLLVKPLLVAGCELEDMRLAQGDGHAMMIGAFADHAGGDCCPGQLCGECCTAGTVLQMAAAPTPSMTIAGHPPVAPLAGFDPTSYRVETRPPIAA